MNHSLNYFLDSEARSILLSVKPRFVNLITVGSKLVELRRAVPAQTLRTIAVYSSSPIQAIVALVDIKQVIEGNATQLWGISRDNGGGITRKELRDYFKGKKTGFAIMLENVRVFKKPVNPKEFFEKFTAPQSFRYLTEGEMLRLVRILEEGK